MDVQHELRAHRCCDGRCPVEAGVLGLVDAVPAGEVMDLLGPG